MSDKICWVVTDGGAGMENQCRGLAEAVALPTVVKRVRPRPPWKWLPPPLCFAALRSLGPDSDRLEPPWPDLWIASGRQSVALTAAVRRASRGATFTVQIQSPGMSIANFDLVVVPRHDRLRGPNVLTTRGALHLVTPERLAAEAKRFAPRLAHLPRPLVAVLIGGSNSCYRLTPEVVAGFADRLATMARETGAGLAVTTSRRTGADSEAELRRRLEGVPAEIWDGSGDNPYFGYLGLADAVVVTCDSVSMVSEACTTGKPVYVLEMEGGNRKFRTFHAGLYGDGITRPFEGRLEQWRYAPLDDTARVAAEVRSRLRLQ